MSLFTSKRTKQADAVIENFYKQRKEQDEHIVTVNLDTDKIHTASKNIQITPGGLIVLVRDSEYFYPWHRVKSIESVGKQDVLEARLI